MFSDYRFHSGLGKFERDTWQKLHGHSGDTLQVTSVWCIGAIVYIIGWTHGTEFVISSLPGKELTEDFLKGDIETTDGAEDKRSGEIIEDELKHALFVCCKDMSVTSFRISSKDLFNITI